MYIWPFKKFYETDKLFEALEVKLESPRKRARWSRKSFTDHLYFLFLFRYGKENSRIDTGSKSKVKIAN